MSHHNKAVGLSTAFDGKYAIFRPGRNSVPTHFSLVPKILKGFGKSSLSSKPAFKPVLPQDKGLRAERQRQGTTQNRS